MNSWAPIRIARGDRDGHRRLTATAAVGLLAGGAMALFGLPPLDVHGPLHYAGIMGPLCGGTRSMHALMSGDVAMAWRYNPISFPLVIGAAGLLVRHITGWATGRWVNVGIGDRRVFWSITTLLLLTLVINQQLHAELLRTSADRFSFLPPLVMTAVVVGAYLLLRRTTRPPSRRAGA